MRIQSSVLPLLFGLAALAPMANAQTLSDDDLPYRVDEQGNKEPLFMHEGTFAVDNGWSWARDNVEIEATYALTGIDGVALFDLLMDDDQADFERTHMGENWRGGLRGRRFESRGDHELFALDAFTVGYSRISLDEVPWTATHHAIREGQIPWLNEQAVEPYVWLTIETGNYEVPREREDPNNPGATLGIDRRWGGRRVLDLGTDTMDDYYYDTDDFQLLGTDMSIRSRKRYSNPTTVRRILIALKMDRGVDEFGIKQAAKTDEREDSVPTVEQLKTFEEEVMRGYKWDGNPAVALKRAWAFLGDRGRLESSPTYTRVLAIKPKAFIRSFRARFHFNEVSLTAVQSLYTNGRTRLEALVAMAREAIADNAIDPASVPAVEAFIAKARGLLDNTQVVARSAERLKALGFEITTTNVVDMLPGSKRPGRGASLQDITDRREIVQQRQVVAEAISELFHELAADMDDGSDASLRRVITRSLSRDLEAYAEWFVEWQREIDMEGLGPIHAMDKFVAIHEGMLGDTAQRDAFNAYGRDEWNDFEVLTQDEFDDMRFQLRNEQVKIWLRQLEAAGSAARGVWFDEAREFYVPSSVRVTGNLLIDTIDFPTMYDGAVWGDTPWEEQNPSVDLNQPQYREFLLHSGLVNEVQIELTSRGAEYPKRLRELRSTVDLPRYFMKWALDSGLATTIDECKALHAELIAIPSDNKDEVLQSRLVPFNEFIETQETPVKTYSATEFREWLDTERLTDQVLDESFVDPLLAPAIEGAAFVFHAYRDMLTFLARLKQARVMEVMERAGAPDTIDWQPAVASKGQTALSLLRDAATPTDPNLPGPGGGGLIDIISGNHSDASAATVTRKVYADREIVSGQDDWYKIELAPDETARFTIDFDHGQGDLDMALFRDVGEPELRRFRVSESVEDQESLEYRTTSGRTVWVRVYGYSSAEGGYTLTVE